MHKPSDEERSRLLEEIGPLPLRGAAWPRWIKVLACAVLILIAYQIVKTAMSPAGLDISPVVTGSIMLCYLALLVLARYMLVSETIISRKGISQTWLSRREVSWDDLHFAKFIPLIGGKRLVCFTARGRPVVFQAGTRELEIAFARISLVYRRK
ncbi:MAG: hypothetical protein WC284_00560 [Candidimonas sp.]|jgi:hypothetical protein